MIFSKLNLVFRPTGFRFYDVLLLWSLYVKTTIFCHRDQSFAAGYNRMYKIFTAVGKKTAFKIDRSFTLHQHGKVFRVFQIIGNDHLPETFSLMPDALEYPSPVY